MTRREARRKLGSRSTRRRNTNGKNIPGRPLGNGGRVVHMYKYPRPRSRRVAVAVARLMRGESA